MKNILASVQAIPVKGLEVCQSAITWTHRGKWSLCLSVLYFSSSSPSSFFFRTKKKGFLEKGRGTVINNINTLFKYKLSVTR